MDEESFKLPHAIWVWRKKRGEEIIQGKQKLQIVCDWAEQEARL